MRTLLATALATLSFSICVSGHAQSPGECTHQDTVFVHAACQPGSGNAAAAHHDGSREILDAGTVRRRTLGLVLGHAAAIGAYGKAKWWQDGFTGNFRSVNEGWFGRNSDYGGADKLGHFTMNYAGTRLFTRAFAWAGQEPAQARELAAWLMLGTFAAVEVLDGYSRQWSFSREDVVMNVAGVGFGMLLEARPELDRMLDFRIHYLPSGGNDFDPFGDYSGQTYLLVAKAAAFPRWRDHPVMRYIEFSIGYGTRGFTRGGSAATENRERNVYVGVSLNLSELLDAKVFRGSGRHARTQQFADTFLEFVQVPGTGAALKRSLD